MIPLANRHVKDANLQLNRIDIIQELPVNTRLYDIVQELPVHTRFQNGILEKESTHKLLRGTTKKSETYCPRDHLIMYY